MGVEPADAEALALRVPLPCVSDAMAECEFISEGLRTELADRLAVAHLVAAWALTEGHGETPADWEALLVARWALVVAVPCAEACGEVEEL